MTIRDFRDLNVWQLGKELVIDIYQLTGNFPREEIYGLVAQVRRAAVSIPSNIAEGFSREHNKDYRRFLFIALGSCAEVETQIEIAHTLDYLSETEHHDMLEKINHESRMLWNLIKRLSNND